MHEDLKKALFESMVGYEGGRLIIVHGDTNEADAHTIEAVVNEKANGTVPETTDYYDFSNGASLPDLRRAIRKEDARFLVIMQDETTPKETIEAIYRSARLSRCPGIGFSCSMKDLERPYEKTESNPQNL